MSYDIHRGNRPITAAELISYLLNFEPTAEVTFCVSVDPSTSIYHCDELRAAQSGPWVELTAR